MFHIHKWKTVFDDGPKKVRVCEKCGKVTSTQYDMATGETYWVNGNLWMNEIEEEGGNEWKEK